MASRLAVSVSRAIATALYSRMWHPCRNRFRSVLVFFFYGTEYRTARDKTGTRRVPYEYGTDYDTARKMRPSFRAVSVENSPENGRFSAVPFSVPYPSEPSSVWGSVRNGIRCVGGQYETEYGTEGVYRYLLSAHCQSYHFSVF